jgi:hypothetical protein
MLTGLGAPEMGYASLALVTVLIRKLGETGTLSAAEAAAVLRDAEGMLEPASNISIGKARRLIGTEVRKSIGVE